MHTYEQQVLTLLLLSLGIIIIMCLTVAAPQKRKINETVSRRFDFEARNVRLSLCEFSSYLYICIQYIYMYICIYNTRVGCSRGYSHEIACLGMRWFFVREQKRRFGLLYFFTTILHYIYMYNSTIQCKRIIHQNSASTSLI